MLHQAKFIIIQTVLLAAIAVLWFFGLLSKPFDGATGILCWIILAVGALGLLCVFLRRWADAEWVAVHVVRLGLLGTVVGLIMAFSVAGSTNFDAESLLGQISSVISGMYVALYATLAAVATNLWIKINIRLLAD
jgi:hypothetical protein